MACLNTNGFLTFTGVGLFGSRNGTDNVISVKSINGSEKGISKIMTTVNIAGWIPGVSLVAGVASIVFGVMAAAGGKFPKSLSVALITRGVVQVAQLGILLAPFDIWFSLVRLVREHMKHRVPHHA